MMRGPSGTVVHFLVVMMITFGLSHACEANGSEHDLFSKGKIHFQAGRFQEAFRAFAETAEIRTEDAEVYYYLGLTQSRLNRHKEAALSLEKAGELDSSIPGIHLNLGIAYYKLQAFGPAFLEMNRALQNDPENGSAHFFMGMIYQGKEDYQASIPYFKKAMDLDTDFAQMSWYYTGIAHLKSGNEKASKDAFNKAIQTDPESDMAAEAGNYLNSMKSKTPAKKWWVEAGLGLEYDDNLTVEAQDLVSNESDIAAVFELEAGFKFLDQAPYEGEISYNFYQSDYDDLSQFDLQSHSLDISLERDFDEWDLGLDYGYTAMSLGGDGFLRTHTVTPSVGYSFRSNLYGNLSYIYQDKDFREELNNTRDADYHSPGFDMFYFFMNNQAYARIGYRFEDEDAVGPELDYKGHRITAAIQVPFPYESKLGFTYKYHKKDYDTITPSIGENREDDKKTYNLVWRKNISKHVEFKFDYQYIDSDSNLSSANYHENVLFGGVTFSF